MSGIDERMDEILKSVRESPTYLNLWSAYKKIQQLSLKPSEDANLRTGIAIVGSSTLEPLAACFDIKIRLEGFHSHTFVGGFNTYRQEAMDKTSELYKAEPNIIVLAVDAWSLLDQKFLSNYPRMSGKSRSIAMKEIVNSITAVAEVLEKNSTALVLVNNFIVPTFSPLGVADNKQKLGFKKFFRRANQLLEEKLESNSNVFVVDLDSVASDFGKSRSVNWNTYYRGSVPFSEEFTPIVANEYMRYFRALKGFAKKCIVLDLDNTLWGGIIGEDGIEGIKLGPTSPGIEYVEFQRALLSLYNRGVILAVDSKNNFDDAIKVLREHPHQVLKEEHFAALRINWQNKAANIVELAKEINIGFDSMVFIDDSPVEREQIRRTYPEVMVVDLPKNPRLYRATLESLNVFDVLSLTKEDLTRGEMYVGKRKRTELEQSSTSIEDFLRTLEIKVRVKLTDDFDTPRVVQLIGKTNQFNLTTRRYTDVEAKSLRDAKESAVYSMSVQDKFGDEGVVGVAIVRKEDMSWTIDSFLMSCRVIGRSVETAFLAKIIADIKSAGAKRVIGEYIPTKKNAPAADFYERHGFAKQKATGDGASWMLDLAHSTVEVPDWIHLIEE
ncbi:MAG: HAD-IIIC family phosphatase [Candidatus Thorarchaeota archaeon]